MFFLGGFFGLVIALLARLKKPLAITIAIETAVQNTNIATIILRTSLPQPWADIRYVPTTGLMYLCTAAKEVIALKPYNQKITKI